MACSPTLDFFIMLKPPNLIFKGEEESDLFVSIDQNGFKGNERMDKTS